jgi:4-alpha-glucanotransferase
VDNGKIFHFMGLIMHQPAGNLLDMLNGGNDSAHDARQILLAYQRPVAYAERYRSEARFCVCFSGTLLEQLQDPYLVRRCSDIVDIPRMLERYALAENIDLAGTGYYHPLFPLIPEDDWDDHIVRGRNKIVEVFGRSPTVFWPPEMGFSCNMIPRLARCGYKYSVCDGVHLRPIGDPIASEINVYQAYIAEHAGERVVLIPRDGFLSGAQQGGTHLDWFDHEASQRAGRFPRPTLVTTWTDGENGGWFRIEDEREQFWGGFFAPYMDQVRSGIASLTPTSISEYLAKNPTRLMAVAETGTWEYNPSQGDPSFWKWAHLLSQRDVLNKIRDVSRRFAAVEWPDEGSSMETAASRKEAVRKEILLAEASDNLWHGENWLWKSIEAVRRAHCLLDEVDPR